MKKHFVKSFHIKVCLLIITNVVLAPACRLINSQISSNETSAVQVIQTIRTCQTQYAKKHDGNFAPNFDGLVKSGCLDADVFDEQRSFANGYIFETKVFESTKKEPAFLITADPKESKGFNKTGEQHYYFDSILGVIKETSEDRQATPADPWIQALKFY